MIATDIEMAISRSKKTKRALAKAVGLSEQALYNKINGLTEFKASEIKVLSHELGLNAEEVNHIFFS